MPTKMGANKTLIFGAIFLTGAYILRESMKSDVEKALDNKNVKSFLAMIATFESGGQYDVLYGGSRFADFSSHPNRRIPFYNPKTQKDDFSTAAGAYQINFPTWLTIQGVAFLPDFSKHSQDLAAIWLLKMRGILDDVITGRFNIALEKASKTWASLPYSDSGQRKVKYNAALNTYIKNGGSLNESAAA